MSMPTEKPKRRRLDLVLVERGLASTRQRAQALILAGDVQVNGETIRKASADVAPDAAITLKAELPYVSRGGYKLAHALDVFGVDVAGQICADIGASTGGFTDVLLQHGALRVYAVDVGYGILAWKLRSDTRVVVMERTNIRHVDALPEPVSFISIDVSFISLRLVLPVARKLLIDDGCIITLIKPQFEAGREQVGSGGVVRDPMVHRSVLAGLLDWLAGPESPELIPLGLTASPIRGPAGNIEFLALLGTRQYAANHHLPPLDIAPAIEHAMTKAEQAQSNVPPDDQG